MDRTLQDLQQLQALPLNLKIRMTEERIRTWVREYGEDGCYISFSGGKDSTVLLHIIRERMGYKNIPAVFVDVPTQYPELREFAKTFDNVEIIKPKISFMEVCEKYGFPLISKEVSECVYGARKYLTSILESESLNERTNERTGTYRYFYDKVCGQGKYAKSIGGGYDRKYRKLRGLCEFAKRTDANQDGRQQSRRGVQVSVAVGDADNGQSDSDKGEYP